VRPRRLTGGPRLSTAVPLSRAPSLSRSLPSGANLSVPVSFARSLSLSLCLAGPVRQCRAVVPARPFLLTVSWACPISSTPSALAVDRRVRTRARRRVSRSRHPPTRPAPLLRAPPVPRAHPSPHFAQLHPLSRFAHAASHRRRPTPAFPAIRLVGDRSKPPRAPP
jgi:hypothetical protein